MKKSLFYSLLISLSVLSCSKEEPANISLEGVHIPLDPISLKYMPYEGHPTLIFVNELEKETKLTTYEGLELDTVWNYNHSGESHIYYSQKRRLRLTGYRPDSLHMQLLVDLSVGETKVKPYQKFDALRVLFGGGDLQTLDFNLITSTKGGNATLKDAWISPEPEYFSDITLLGRSFSEVYAKKSDNGQEIYYAKDIGVIAFRDTRHLWVLDRME